MCADLTYEVSERKKDCARGYSYAILAKNRALFYPCPEKPDEAELKIMEKFV